MAIRSIHIPQTGYRELPSGNYFTRKFGYLTIIGATPPVASIGNNLLFGRGSDRAMDRGTK